MRSTWNSFNLLCILNCLAALSFWSFSSWEFAEKKAWGDFFSLILLVPGSSQTALHSCLALLPHTCGNHQNKKVYVFRSTVSDKTCPARYMQGKSCISCGSTSGQSTSLVAVYAFLTRWHDEIQVLGGLMEALWTISC